MSPSGPAGLPKIWLVFAVIVVELTGFGIVIPVLPFISPALGGDEMDVALVIAVNSLCAGLVGPFWGGMSDRIGRRFVLMICLFGGGVSYVLLALASELWMVYAARALGGLMSGALPVASALMADLSPPERRAKAMGLVGTAFGIGLIVGPFLGGLLAGSGESFLLPGICAGGLAFLSTVLAFLVLDNDIPAAKGTTKTTAAGDSLPAFVARHRATLLVCQYVLHTFAVTATVYLCPLWLAAYEGWGPREVGILFGLVGVVMIIVQGFLIDWLTTRFGLLRVLASGMSFFVLSLVMATVASDEWQRSGVIFLAFAGGTVCLPVLNTIASSVAGSEERGRMMGLTAMAASLGRVIGPVVTGFILALGGYELAWLVVALPAFLVVIWSQTGARPYGAINSRNSGDSQQGQARAA